MPFRYVIHAATLDMYDFNPLFLLRLRQRTSDDTLRKAALASLDLAQSLNLHSVGFSPMGSGIGAMAIETCCRIIGEGATSHPFNQQGTIQLAVLPDKTTEKRIMSKLPENWF